MNGLNAQKMTLKSVPNVVALTGIKTKNPKSVDQSNIRPLDDTFRVISRFPDYGVTDEGEIINLHYQRKNNQRKVKPFLDKDGYHRVGLYNNKKRTPVFVHRMVAIAFIPNPENKPEVNHKNGIKTANNKTNLEWVTRKENAQHSRDTGLQVNSEKQRAVAKKTGMSCRKLTSVLVKQLRKEYRETKVFQKDLAIKYGISPNVTSKIIRRKSYKEI